MNQELSIRPARLSIQNGKKAPLPFSDPEYDRRLSRLRSLMDQSDVGAMLLTSMHNVAYYSGFLYCSFGRPYACVVTQDRCVTISANIDYGQPQRRSVGENIVYTDWQQNNFWRAVRETCGSRVRVGIEADHMTLSTRSTLSDFLPETEMVDLHGQVMRLRMVKSE
ncbi:MAG: aminopeptidase P family N-terminal domain-containing protein, partial [bacterium]